MIHFTYLLLFSSSFFPLFWGGGGAWAVDTVQLIVHTVMILLFLLLFVCLFHLFVIAIMSFYVRVDTVISRGGMNKVFCIL